MGGRIRSVRNGRWLPRGKHVLLTHISNRSGGDPLVIALWLTNHDRDLETSLGLVDPRAGPPVKGLIVCKPNLDHGPALHRALDTGAPRGCHVAPFPRLDSRRCPNLRPSSAETGPMGPEGRVSEGPLRVSEGDFLRV